ncbi:MAG: LON peptidase substrate-binding domain-containing protein [Gammaproteobacteria bacterium]|nr:LON peptidase substrate-binding domain-containing protein [Gammaproteobacteria bacterium]
MTEIPLFPLKTVLLPGNLLTLKIFEPRYLDMIATCMREESVFGVVLIRDGEETSLDSEICTIGTTARISDWEHRADGLLGITASGEARFAIEDRQLQHDGLAIARVRLLEESRTVEVPDQFHYMRDLLDHIGAQQMQVSADELTFSEILYRLVYLLPLDADLKQRLLEIPECGDRATILHAELIRLGIIQYVKPESQG